MIKKLSIVFLLILIFSSTAGAIEFSADSITTQKGGFQTKGKLFYKADKFRMEMQGHSDMNMIVITRVDKKVAWNLMPDTKTYMEMPLNMQNRPKVEEKYEGEIERKQVGSETIDGHPTKKYLITYRTDNETHQVYQWLATDINMPVKTAAIDGSWSHELRNIKIGNQPDNLFEIPAGYQKMQMPHFPGMSGNMNMMKRTK